MINRWKKLLAPLKNLTWLGLTNAAAKPIWFVFVTAVCMRFLGVDEFGVMVAALSIAMIASSFIDLGMAEFSMREIAREPGSASRYFTNMMLLRSANAILAGTAAVGAAVLLGYRGTSLAAVFFAAVYALSLNMTEYCRAMYRALERLPRESIMLVVEKTLVIAGGAWLLLQTRSAHWTLAGMAAGMAATLLLNVGWIHRRLAPLAWRETSRTFILGSVKAMIPIGIAGIFTQLYYRIDAVMIESFLGSAPTGQYGVAYRILEGLAFIPSIIVFAGVYPRSSRLQSQASWPAFRRLTSFSGWGMASFSVPAAAVLTAFAPFVISLLDPDPAFGPAAAALRVVVWGFPLVCIKTLLYATLLTMDDQRFLALAFGAVVVANITLNLFMIPVYGIIGAAVATVVSEAVVVLVCWLRYRNRLRRVTTGHQNVRLNSPGEAN